MRRTRDQGLTTGLISLGLLANRLELMLNVGQDVSLPVQISANIYKQWEDILQETIDFIEAPEEASAGRQERKARFLSRAHYLEQIYTATPEPNRQTLEALAKYLNTICKSVKELSNNKPLKSEKKRALSTFAESVANEAIKGASKYHQEPHFQKFIGFPEETEAHV